MSDFLTAIHEAEIRLAAEGTPLDLTRLRNWWSTPIHSSDSLEAFCRGYRAERLLATGVREATDRFCTLRWDRPFRDLMCAYLQAACSLATDPEAPCHFDLPIWLCWIRDTARAINTWKRCMEMLTPGLTIELESTIWQRGVDKIREGYPRSALHPWQDSTERLRNKARRESDQFLEAIRDFRQAAKLAGELALDLPLVSGEFADARVLQEAVSRWHEEILVPRLDGRFWDVHVPFLTRTRYRAAPPFRSKGKPS